MSDLLTAYVTPDIQYHRENTLQILAEVSGVQFGLIQKNIEIGHGHA